MNFEVMDVFENFKQNYHHRLTPESLLDSWYHAMQHAPTLRDLCIQDSQEVNLSWETVALERVFHRTHQDYVKMTTVHARLKRLIPQMKDRLSAFYAPLKHVRFVLYHGLGNGAGWATNYLHVPSILLGIDKIAALDWSSDEELQRLIAHEYMHVVHQDIRGAFPIFQDPKEEAIMRLYIEGVASFYETKLADLPERLTRWEAQCQVLETRLKTHYQEVLHRGGEGYQVFYGDWHTVEGLSDVGYYLGKQMIQSILKTHDFMTLAEAPFEKIVFWVEDYLAQR